MDMELKYLSAFAAVCEEGTISRAAEALHLTQPAVSYQIRRLEEQLGVRLFERVGRRLVLTQDGEWLREFCRRFFAEFSLLRAKLSSGDAALTAPLRIASVSGFGRYVLFPILCEEEFVDLRFHLWYPREDDLLEMLESGRCDLGFVYEPRISSLLDFAPVYVEELVLIASPHDDPAAAAWRRLATYETRPMVAYDEGHFVFGKWFESQFGRQPKSTFSSFLFEELEEVVEMVSRNRGVSIVPEHTAREAIERGRVVAVRPFAKRRATNAIHAVTRAGSFVHAEAERLADMIRDASPFPLPG